MVWLRETTCDCGQAVSLKFKVLAIFKILYPATCKRFVVFNAVLCIMHLSMSNPTYPRSGRGGDCWGFANARMQISHPWGQL